MRRYVHYVGTKISGQLSRRSGSDGGDGWTKKKFAGVYLTSREAVRFYVKSFSKFSIGDRWLCSRAFLSWFQSKWRNKLKCKIKMYTKFKAAFANEWMEKV